MDIKSRIIWSETNLLNNQYAVLYKIMWYNAVYIKNIFWQIPSYVHLRFENLTLWEFTSSSFFLHCAEHSFRVHVPGEHLSIMASEPSCRRPSFKLQHWASHINLWIQGSLLYAVQVYCNDTSQYHLHCFNAFVCIQR